MIVDRAHTSLDPGVTIGFLREMLRIRRFEEKCVELYSAGHIRGFLHLYIGEEAVAVGCMAALTPEDAVVSTYREHGHALARGVDAARLMAEMYGKQEGCSRGRGGSMHVFDARTRLFGGNAIVGGGLPLAVGLALADRLAGRSQVTACFFGDGAVAEGEFHESLNLAALWNLPVLFACENNRYAMGTRIDRALAEPDIAARAMSYGVRATVVNGMDVLAVADGSRHVVDRIRGGGGPELVEFRTYRFRAHSMFDAELYREKRDVDVWRQQDPIRTCADRLAAAGLLDDRARADLEAAVDQEIAAAVAFAEAGTLEPVEQLTRDVYTERR